MTKVLRIGYKAVLEAAVLIMKGRVVAYPTDTVYGLGADPLNPKAVRRLVRAKNRRQGRLPLLVDSIGRAEEIGKFDGVVLCLARRFWPGPLTLVIPSRIRLPGVVTGSTGDVGLRIPHQLSTLELVRACGGALVGTSANVSGNPSLETALEVAKELDGKVDLVLDGGRTGSGVESSVVRVEDGAVSILREKSIGKERIFSAVGALPKESK